MEKIKSWLDIVANISELEGIAREALPKRNTESKNELKILQRLFYQYQRDEHSGIRDRIGSCSREKIKNICLRDYRSVESNSGWKVKMKFLNKLRCFIVRSAKSSSFKIFTLYFAFYNLLRYLSSCTRILQIGEHWQIISPTVL